MKDILVLYGSAILVILLAVWASQTLTIRGKVSYFAGRKLLHFVAVGTCAWVINLTNNPLVLAYIFLAFVPMLWYMVLNRSLEVSKGESLGIALFPLAFGLLLSAGVSTRLVAVGALILAISDPMAGIVGKYCGQQRKFWKLDPKSIVGSFTYFVITFVILFFVFPDHNYIVLKVATISTVAEQYSWRGSDNLSIPLVTTLALHWYMG